MVDPPQKNGFENLVVAAFESRMGKEMESFITRYGGIPCVASSMKEIPLDENTRAFEFGDRLLAGQVDIVILLTGVGTKSLVAVWETRWDLVLMVEALARTSLIARGQKSVQALRGLGLTPTLVVPEPNTWEDLVHVVDLEWKQGLGGLRVAVQEYGVSNAPLLNALEHRGAEVFPVPVYRWALPDELGPLQAVLTRILDGRVPVLLFTNAAQVDHVVMVLEQEGKLERFRQGLTRVMVASIGTITSDRLKHHRFPVDLEPSRSKMGILVKEASERCGEILRSKRV